jgi:hypothetical protein
LSTNQIACRCEYEKSKLVIARIFTEFNFKNSKFFQIKNLKINSSKIGATSNRKKRISGDEMSKGRVIYKGRNKKYYFKK